MTALINASTSSGVVVTSDTSGSLAFQSNGTTIMTVASTGVSTQVGAPAFSAYANASQSVSNSTWTKVQINTEIFDTANCFDSTTNYRFTPNVAGYYQVNAIVRMTATSPTEYFVSIYKNGSAYTGGIDLSSATVPTTVQLPANELIYMNGTTDYIELYALITAAASQTFVWGTVPYATSRFSASMVRSA